MSNQRIIENIRSIAAVIGGLSIEDGPWIAGGVVRAWLTGERIRPDDYDLFFASDEQADRVEVALIAAGGVVTEHDALFQPSTPLPDDEVSGEVEPAVLRSVYYRIEIDGIDMVVNVARTHLWPDVHALLAAFDFTVCMAATDGERIVVGPTFHEDTAHRRLVPSRETTRYRVGKYIGKGFKLSPELMRAWQRTAHPESIPGLVAPAGKGTAAQAGPIPDWSGE